MTPELQRLHDQWILAFCEAPPILDEELMRGVLLAHGEGASNEEADAWPSRKASSPATR